MINARKYVTLFVFVFLFGFALNYVGVINPEHIQDPSIFDSRQATQLSKEGLQSHSLFIENLGQLPDSIHYYSNLPEGMVAFTESKITFYIRETEINVTFLGSNKVHPQGEDFLSSYSNFFQGSQIFAWARHCHKVVYHDLYEGVTLVYYFTSQGLKYDFIVDPYADINQIKMSYTGLEEIAVEPTKLIFTIEDIKLYDDELQAWYESTKKPIDIQFKKQVERNNEHDSEKDITICFVLEESIDS
ncbi:MAG: hypothetical protein ACFFBD_06260, partial [Candidatus Hodarchaeota archaeon]